LDGAWCDLDRDIGFNPSLSTIYFGRARVGQKKNDLNSAMADCIKALSRKPD